MSKASNNTAKKVAKSSTGIVALRAIVATMPALRAAYSEAVAVESKAESRLSAALPPRPEPATMPEAMAAITDGITLGEFRKLPTDHPYAVWTRETEGPFKAAMAEYYATRDRLSAELGLSAAEATTRAADKALCRAGQKAMRIAATGIEAMALKLRAFRLASFEPVQGEIKGLLATIDATAGAAGFKTTI